MKRKAQLPDKFKIGTYIDPLTDFGFKHLFGSEPNKELLIAFLNNVFDGRKVIVDLRFNKNERAGPVSKSRRMIFDLNCTGKNGEQFIIEVQRIRQPNFKDRALFYSSRLIHDQAPQGGNWDYSLKEVYFIGILDFSLDDSDEHSYLHYVRLAYERTGLEFYRKLGFIFIEIPKFVKTERELETDIDKWLFVLKNMSRLNKLPVILNSRIFAKLFQLATVSNLTKEEFMKYEKDLMASWDEYSLLKFAKEEGFEKGIEKGIEKGAEERNYVFVTNMLLTGKFSVTEIAGLAGVSEAFVRKVKKQL